MRAAKLITVVAVSVILCRAAEAGMVIPASATASSTIGGGFDRIADHTRDKSGLSGDQHTVTPDGYMWLTAAGVPSANITFDLGSVQQVDGFHLWNYNEAGDFTNRGAKSVSVSVSTDGITYAPRESFTFQEAPGVNSYTGEDYPMASVAARYVKLDIANNFGGPTSEYMGLSEIRFATSGELAKDLVRPASAVASSEIRPAWDRKAVYTIDSKGLNAAGQHGTATDGFMWLTDFVTTGWIHFDLGAPLLMTGFHMWNYNEAGSYTNRGINTAMVSTSVDGTNWTTPQLYNFTKASGLDTYGGEDYTLPNPVVARYVRFDNATNFGGTSADTVGLSEIRFATPTQITGVTAIASSEYLPDGRLSMKTVDGSGMSGVGNEWADNDCTNMWLTSSGNIVGRTITFDLNGTYALLATRIWNYNEAGAVHRGIETLDIAVSLDGLSFQTLAGPASGHFALAQAPGTSNYSTADLLDLGGIATRYVRFTVLDYFGTNPGSDYVGLSEVRFYGLVPEPSTLAMLLGLSGIGLSGRLWRRRRA